MCCQQDIFMVVNQKVLNVVSIDNSDHFAFCVYLEHNYLVTMYVLLCFATHAVQCISSTFFHYFYRRGAANLVSGPHIIDYDLQYCASARSTRFHLILGVLRPPRGLCEAHLHYA